MALFSRRKTDLPPEVIDLREPAPAKPPWGSPRPCPACEGRGYVDHIDPFRVVMYLRCTERGHRHELTKAEVDVDDPSEAFTL